MKNTQIILKGMKTMTDFVSALKRTAEKLQPNVSVTENGAIGYKTTGTKLLDLNFMLSGMRNMNENMIWNMFLPAYNDNPTLALLWLFFIRDVRGGAGERRTFRAIFKRFCRENSAVAIRLLPLIPFYGRWDDLLDVFCGDVPRDVRESAFKVIDDQLCEDLNSIKVNKPTSLLGKWMYSPNTSSIWTRRKAEMLRSQLGMTPRQYRQTLSRLRRYIDVTERRMSSGEWGEIDYETVPSRAAMNYRNAFAKHDGERYDEYLTNVKAGNAKINSGVLYPYDLAHAYIGGAWGDVVKPLDETLEAQWNALPNTVPDGQSTLVVVDGSGSMCCRIGKTKVTCHDVAKSLGIYFAEKLTGPYHNQFITFSANPKYVGFADGLSLHARLEIMYNYDDCSNTDIEKVFDLILDTAKTYGLKQSEIPANILIVSDMEFDEATNGYNEHDEYCNVDKALFDTIRNRWEEAGYKLPRLVFWNVCSRTGTIPVMENDFGVALVSGFSPNIADMVMSGELDPFKCLLDKLTGERYRPVSDALKE